jgi:hypothetical protein
LSITNYIRSATISIARTLWAPNWLTTERDLESMPAEERPAAIIVEWGLWRFYLPIGPLLYVEVAFLLLMKWREVQR